MLINLRNALMAGKRLPYDAEVEYLESTGTQWIDTGVTMTAALFDNAETTIVVQPLVSSSQTKNFFGDGTSWQKGYTFGTISNSVLQASNGYRYTDSQLTLSTTSPNTVVVTKSGFAVDGNSNSGTAISDATTTSGTLLLFGSRRNGVFFTTTPFSGRIYSAKMVANGVTIFDFIPVRVGTVGYLYDRVSGKLFGNAGTGAFAYGNDLKYPIPAE